MESKHVSVIGDVVFYPYAWFGGSNYILKRLVLSPDTFWVARRSLELTSPCFSSAGAGVQPKLGRELYRYYSKVRGHHNLVVYIYIFIFIYTICTVNVTI